MNRAFNVFLSTLLGLCLATGAVAQTGDRLKTPVKVGNGTASEKKMIFDIGSGASNPVIRSTAGGTLQFSNNGVDFSAFGSGAGFGINYMSANQDFELNTNGYAAYQDAAGTSPVDATGGTPTLTVTRTTVSGEIVRGTASGKITKDAVNRQGEGISYALTIDNIDKAKPVAIRFNYKAGAGYTSCDIKVYVVETTGPNVITPNNGGCLPQGEGEFATTVLLKTTATYRLALHVATTSAVAYTMFVDNFRFGPGDVVQGSAIASSIPFVGGGTWNTNTTYEASYDRNGKMATIHYKVSTSGAPNSTTLHLNLPPGITPDTSDPRYNFTDYAHAFGFGSATNDSGPEPQFITMAYTVADGFTPIYYTTAGAAGDPVKIQNFITQSVPFAWGAGDTLTIEWSFPVAEWSDNVFVENTTVEYAFNTDLSDANDTTSFANGESGVVFGNFTATRSKTVRFKHIAPTDKIELQYTMDGGTTWLTPSYDGLAVDFYKNQAGTTYGLGWVQSSSTDIIVYTGQYRSSSSAAFGAAGAPWSDIDNDPVTRWRVVKSSNPLTLGHDVVGQNKSGLVERAGQLKGTNTNDNAQSGYVGEVFENYSGLVNIAASYVPQSISSRVLTAGDYDVSMQVLWDSNGASFGTGADGSGFGGVRVRYGIGDATTFAEALYFEANMSTGFQRFVNGSKTVRVTCDGTNIYVPLQGATITGTTLHFLFDIGQVLSGTPAAAVTYHIRRVR